MMASSGSIYDAFSESIYESNPESPLNAKRQTGRSALALNMALRRSGKSGALPESRQAKRQLFEI